MFLILQVFSSLNKEIYKRRWRGSNTYFWVFEKLDHRCWKDIWNPFASKEIICSFQLSLKFFVYFCMWSEDKVYYLSLIVTSSKDDNSDVSFRVFRGFWPSESDVFRKLLLQSARFFFIVQDFRVWSFRSYTSLESGVLQSLVQNFSFSLNSNCSCIHSSKPKLDLIHWILVLVLSTWTYISISYCSFNTLVSSKLKRHCTKLTLCQYHDSQALIIKIRRMITSALRAMVKHLKQASFHEKVM